MAGSKMCALPILRRRRTASFPFEPVDGCLNGRVRGARLGKRFLNLADGGLAVSPERFQHLEFEPGQTWVEAYRVYYASGHIYYCVVGSVKPCGPDPKSHRSDYRLSTTDYRLLV